MAIRKIRVEGDSVLYKPCKEVEEMTDRTRELMMDMLETMYDAQGVGLAAPQVGILKRLVVIDISEKRNQPVFLVNPVIVDRDGEQLGWEGCLSVPGKSGQVTRPLSVTVKAKNLDMEDITFTATEFFARAVCHELDHLDGHLYVEKVEGRLYDNEELMAEEEEE